MTWLGVDYTQGKHTTKRPTICWTNVKTWNGTKYKIVILLFITEKKNILQSLNHKNERLQNLRLSNTNPSKKHLSRKLCWGKQIQTQKTTIHFLKIYLFLFEAFSVLLFLVLNWDLSCTLISEKINALIGNYRIILESCKNGRGIFRLDGTFWKKENNVYWTCWSSI